MRDLIILCSLAFALHCTSTAYVELNGNNSWETQEPHINDIGFKLVPRFNDKLVGIEHILAFVYPAFTFLYLCTRRSMTLSRQFVIDCATIMILRSMTIAMTILPASKSCSSNSWYPIVGGCYDKIFSGHVAYQTLSILYLCRLGFSVWNYLAIPAEAIILLGLREHYSVDILLAVIIATLVTCK